MGQDRQSSEYKDARNARYQKAHQNDILSEHGKAMRAYFKNTDREERAEIRAKRQAIKDIIEELIKTKKVHPRKINQIMWLFDEEI